MSVINFNFQTEGLHNHSQQTIKNKNTLGKPKLAQTNSIGIY